MPQHHVRQHRWVTEEPDVPFALKVLYEDANIIVVDKPHFLATMPRGMWYRQTAVIRLREQLNEPDIVPAHRLDRMTAGVLVLIRNKAVRGAYQMMFQNRQVSKIYECLAPIAPIHTPTTGTVTLLEAPRPFPLIRRSHITKHRGVMQAYEEPGMVNAQTRIEREGLAYRTSDGQLIGKYRLFPHTGKTHQLRIHMNSLGLPMVGDNYYPTIQPVNFADFSQPLELVARQLNFIDPISGEDRQFISDIELGKNE